MNSGMLCPECNSQDIQKIEKEQTVTTSRNKGVIVVRWMIGCGLAVFILGLLAGEPGNAIIAAPMAGLLFGTPLGLLHALCVKKVVSKTMIHFYYACRTCGMEFQSGSRR